MSNSRTEQILDFAEQEMRRGGFDAVSFRDIASEIGIKSASVHYHFPTKTDLCRAVVRRYADRFLENLGAADQGPVEPAESMARLAAAYQAAYDSQNANCLCAVLGAVLPSLPTEAGSEVAMFYDRLLEWTNTALAGDKRMTAPVIISLLQGAMALSVARDDVNPLVDARDHLSSVFR